MSDVSADLQGDRATVDALKPLLGRLQANTGRYAGDKLGDDARRLLELLRSLGWRPIDTGPQATDTAQYEGLDVENDPLLLALLTMPVRNRNESAFMLHIAPTIAAHLHAEGWVKP